MFVQQSKIELCNVTKKFGELEVLKNINATFEQSKTYSITGISGTGKSTLLHIIAGIDFPTSGKVLFDGTDISVFDMQQRELFLSKNLGLIFLNEFGNLNAIINASERAVAGPKKRACNTSRISPNTRLIKVIAATCLVLLKMDFLLKIPLLMNSLIL